MSDENKELNEAKMDGFGLIQMYQSGFLDGVNHNRPTKKYIFWDEIKEACLKAFEFRYVNKINKAIRMSKKYKGVKK